jgi:hypothetical protein
MRSVVLLCLVSALAYGQSATPPGAPAFSAVESAPHTVGQPGHLAPEAVPRSPHARILPETPETRREAGVWAGDEEAPEPRVLVLEGVRIPIPEVEDANDLARVASCGRGTSAALSAKKEGMREALDRALPDRKTCTVYLAWRHCMLAAFWPEEGRESAERIVKYADSLMMEDPHRCKTWALGLKDYLTRPFDWHLRAWYRQQYKRDVPP